jgi:hypothetical protein
MFHVSQVLAPTKRMFTYYFVVVQLSIEIYSLPVSTANGIKFRFQFY